jgi:MoaA/NifB/PqqE/SkfB family radical SAM enzyme
MADKEYYSCEQIEAGLNMQSDFLTFCCSSHAKAGNPYIAQFNGGKLPADIILRERQKLIQKNQSQTPHPSCRNCPFLIKKVWAQKEYMLRSITINTFTVCNLRCDYCYTLKSEYKHYKQNSYALLPIFTDAIQNKYLAHDTTIFWGGGEPTILKDFEELGLFLLQHNVYQFVNTNGIIYSEFIEAALREKRVNIQISVDSGTRESYRKIKGKDVFEQVWNNIQRYSIAGTVFVKYILKENNSDDREVKEFIHQCQIRGVKHIIVAPESVEFSKEIISDKTLQSVVTMVIEARKSCIDINEPDTNCFGKYAIRIEDYMRQRLGNKKRSFGEYLNRLLSG